MSDDGRVGVALVIGRLGRGGAERILVSLANRLDRSRFRVDVVTVRDAGELAADLAPDVAVHALERRRPWDLAAFARFRAILERREVAIVHTHSHLSAYFVALSGARRPPSWLHVAHGHYPEIRRSPLRWLDRLLLSRVDHWLAASSDIALYASAWLGIPPDRCTTIPNGVETSLGHDEDGEGPPARAPVFTIAQVGRMAPQKAQLLAIEAAHRLRARNPSFRWLLVGRADSAYARTCRRRIEQLGLQEHVRVLGERDDVGHVLRGADVGVLTSRAEGHPVALLEYMAAGLPVVTTDVGEGGTTVRRSGGGRVVAPGDVAGLAGALEEYAAHPELRSCHGRVNREHAAEAYGVESMVRRVAAVYQSVARGDRSPRPIGQSPTGPTPRGLASLALRRAGTDAEDCGA